MSSALQMGIGELRDNGNDATKYTDPKRPETLSTNYKIAVISEKYKRDTASKKVFQLKMKEKHSTALPPTTAMLVIAPQPTVPSSTCPFCEDGRLFTTGLKSHITRMHKTKSN